MTPKETRHALADAIRAVAPAGVTVYNSPPESVTAPAVVISPRQPYRTISSYCDWEVNYRVTGLVQRGAGADSLDYLDDLLDAIIPAIRAFAFVTIDSVGEVGYTTDVGAVDLVTGAVDLTAHINEGRNQ